MQMLQQSMEAAQEQPEPPPKPEKPQIRMIYDGFTEEGSRKLDRFIECVRGFFHGKLKTQDEEGQVEAGIETSSEEDERYGNDVRSFT